MTVSVDRLGPDDQRLVIGDDFLAEDAWSIHDVIEHACAGARIEIDFRRVRDCHDFALSLLARDMLAGRSEISLHGMTQHQERVLAYFGVSAASAEAVSDFDPM